jgi:hypothetical protein
VLLLLRSGNLHPRFERRLDAYGGLHLLEVAVFDVLLHFGANVGQRLVGDGALARGVGRAADQVNDCIRVLFYLPGLQVVKIPGSPARLVRPDDGVSLLAVA